MDVKKTCSLRRRRPTRLKATKKRMLGQQLEQMTTFLSGTVPFHTSVFQATYASLDSELLIQLLLSIMVASMFFVIFSSKIIYSVFFLIIVYLCSFPLILLLGFDFLATALVIIYVGAVVIFFIFILMSCQLQGISSPSVPQVLDSAPLRLSASIDSSIYSNLSQQGVDALSPPYLFDVGGHTTQASGDKQAAPAAAQSKAPSTLNKPAGMSLRLGIYGMVPVFLTLGVEFVGRGTSTAQIAPEGVSTLGVGVKHHTPQALIIDDVRFALAAPAPESNL